MNTSFTSAPVGTDAAEFCDHSQLKQRFGIGRSLAYLLNGHGDIKSKVLRRKGCIKGKRLWNVASVREFLAKQSDEIDPRLSANCKAANRVMREKQKAKREKAFVREQMEEQIQ
jgi:hypothetical protein